MTRTMRFYKRLLDLSLLVSYVLLMLLIMFLVYGVAVNALNFSGTEYPIIREEYAYLRPIFISITSVLIISVISARVFLGFVSDNEKLESVEDYKHSLRKKRKNDVMNQLKMDIVKNELQYNEEKYLTKKERKRIKEKSELETSAFEAITADRGVRISEINTEPEEDFVEETIQEEPIQEETIQEELIQEETIQEEPIQEETIQEELIQEETIQNELNEPVVEDVIAETVEEPIQPVVEVEQKTKKIVIPKKREYYTRLNKSELTNIIAEDMDISQYRAKKYLNGLLGIIQEELVNGNTVRIDDFGKFTTRVVQRHQAIDPRNGEALTVPEHNVVKFTAFKAFKDQITGDVITTSNRYLKKEPVQEQEKKEEQEQTRKENVQKATSKPKVIKRTKKDVISYIHNTTKLSKNKANKFLLTLTDVIKESLVQNDDVTIKGLGKFTTIHIPNKEAVNPSTNEKMIVPEHNQVRLRFDAEYKSKFK